MLSHCDEKHFEMMWRECSSCPQRDGKLAVAFVYSFWVIYARICVCILVGSSLGALVIVCTHFVWHSNPNQFLLCGFASVSCFLPVQLFLTICV